VNATDWLQRGVLILLGVAIGIYLSAVALPLI